MNRLNLQLAWHTRPWILKSIYVTVQRAASDAAIKAWCAMPSVWLGALRRRVRCSR